MVGAFSNDYRAYLGGTDIYSYSVIALRHDGLLIGMFVRGEVGEFVSNGWVMSYLVVHLLLPYLVTFPSVLVF